MTTIPARLAKTTISSGSWPVAQARARSLYRAWYRAAPEIVTLYAANIPATAIRAKIRQRYEKNKYVDDLQAVDILLAKSYMDYQETLNAWKMDSHLMRMFNDEEIPPQPVAFLDKFYYSRDDPEAVQPAA
ncbi:NADH dehydrogenase, alpha subcomplex, subunit 6 [Cystobasidium minutum MCA 4210]|uniref:NADH dehydrogenase, alpha subcomplex, subunit 6 n=1 Tax=Cystobasidium minutum MCA 4210 TaxID=1397322 RepID=UPI0034CD9DCC|eukprot:jgi/Rhomi1/198716/gm1.6930_g